MLEFVQNKKQTMMSSDCISDILVPTLVHQGLHRYTSLNKMFDTQVLTVQGFIKIQNQTMLTDTLMKSGVTFEMCFTV